MIEKILKRKITIIFLALMIILLIYLFPKKNESYYFPMETEYITSNNDDYVYLIDNNNYVALTSMYIKNTNALELAKEIISILTINSKEKTYIPDGFKQIIPKNTKINDISLKDELLKIDFSKEILNVTKEKSRKMIESLVYSLTNIEGINKIMIFVDGEKLIKIPNTNEILPNTLDRNIGINRLFELESFKNITETTIYFIGEYNESTYYIPVTLYNNDKKEKIEIIINELKTSINNNNLFSYLRSNVELLDYEIKENNLNLSFNEFLYDNFNKDKVLEEVKYSIYLSAKDNYDIKNVIFIVNNEKISTETIKSLEK